MDLHTPHRIKDWFYEIVLKPIHKDEELHRKELVCNLLLLFVLLLLFTLDVLVLISLLKFENSYSGVSLFIMLCITGSIICLLYFSRKGQVDIVSKALIWILITSASYGQILWGADLPSTILLWSFIITASSILISTYFSFYVALGIGIGTMLLQLLEQAHIFIPTKTWKDTPFRLDDAVEYAVVFTLIAGVSWISNREIVRSFIKVKSAKFELQRERDLLEIKIEERTEQLHKTQVEKINSMYQLVEFGRISSGLFHDLMTPLNTLGFSVAQIKKQSELQPDTFTTNIQDIETQLDRCIRTSRGMTDFISLARRQIHQADDETKFEVCKEIESTIYILKSKARQMGVTIFFQNNKNINIFGSPTLFSHIMTNLISNAIDAYDTHSANAISKNAGNSTEIPRIETRGIFIYCRRKKRQVEIKVKDFGCGIPDEIQPHIFETFYTTKSTHGCGIGLSATKHTLEKHFNGTISFISNKQNLQQGTTFTIKIPITRYETSPIESESTPETCIEKSADLHHQT